MKSNCFLYFMLFCGLLLCPNPVRAEALSLDEAEVFAQEQGNNLLSFFAEKDIRTIREFLDNAKTAGFSPILLTSGVETHGLESYNCDYKTLITLNRSNGGATYLEDGYIIRKWAERTLPAPEELAMISDEDPTDTFIGRDTRTSLAFQGFLLYVFAVMLLL